MDALSSLLEALHRDPSEETTWLALADCLEEQGQPDRAKLTRLSTSLRHHGGPDVSAREERQRHLLASGVLPCVPEVGRRPSGATA